MLFVTTKYGVLPISWFPADVHMKRSHGTNNTTCVQCLFALVLYSQSTLIFNLSQAGYFTPWTLHFPINQLRRRLEISIPKYCTEIQMDYLANTDDNCKRFIPNIDVLSKNASETRMFFPNAHTSYGFLLKTWIKKNESSFWPSSLTDLEL